MIDFEKWFWDKYDNCYPIYNPMKSTTDIYLVYDINFIRKLKFSRLIDKDFEYDKISGEVLFHIGKKSFRPCKLIFDELKKASGLSHQEMTLIIKKIISKKYDSDFHVHYYITEQEINFKEYERIRIKI